MQNNQNIRRALNDTLDWLSDQPEDVIHRIFSDKRIPNHADFRWDIGGTEYTVVSYFKADNAEDVLSKVFQLLEDGALK